MPKKRSASSQSLGLADHSFNENEPRAYLGDCAEGLIELKKRGVVIDTLFYDPPYNLDQEYDAYDDRRPLDEYLGWCEGWLRAAYDGLSRSGTFWLVIGDKVVSELDVLAKKIGFRRRANIAWYYTFGVNSTKNFTPSHTHLLYYTKQKTNFVFNADEPKLRIPSARQLIYNDKRANPKGRLPDDTWILLPQHVPNGFDPLGDVWLFSRVCGTFKEKEPDSPNQLPLPLVERCLLATSKPGSLVVDGFCGTGTTGEACVKLGRRFVGFDISANCVINSNERIERAKLSIPRPVEESTKAGDNGRRQRKTNGRAGNNKPGKPRRKSA